MYRIIFLFFFLSGFSSLVFEILWERMLQTVFGSTSFALSTLLTAFMGGMALGSWLSSKYAEDLKRPLRVYGLLEGGIGLYAFVVPVALDYLPVLYDSMFDYYLNDFYLFSLLRFAAAFVILILPTTLMGATLPIVSQWVSRRERLFQGTIGALYGINTFGACAGTLLAGFALLPAFGLSSTNTAFAFVNLALCAIVLAADFFLHEQLEPDDDIDEESDEAEAEMADLEAAAGFSRVSEPIPDWLASLVLGAFALSGAISMAYQVLWTRAYVIILGSSTYSFTLILVAFLIGIAGGSATMSPLVKRIKRPVFWLAITQLGVAAAATIAFFALDSLPAWMFHRFQETINSATEVYVYYFFLVGLVVLLPTFLQGMSFPLVVRAVVHDRKRSGRQVGRAYAFNTFGSIFGSFAAGFILLVTLGLYTSMTLVITINILLALVLAGCELQQKFGKRKVYALGAAALVTLGAFLIAPPIDRVDLTRGMFRVYWAREVYTADKFEEDNPDLLFYEDGLTATVSVEKRGDMHTLKANGKPEASDSDDMMTQILVGLMPYVVRSGYEDVELGGEDSVMVGYGSGVTAGAALQWPLDHLEVIEIEEAMIEASKYFNHVNHKPLQDERMEVIESDGRNYLEYTDKKYEVIVSEPSNPWIAGVASLFTVDHFEHVKQHLTDDGVFAQWVQLYEMKPENVRTIMNTFLQVFPHVQAFSSQAKGTDLILIASKRPLPFPAAGYQRAWSVDSVRKELKRAGVDQIHDLYGLAFMSQEELEDFALGAPLNTDDNGRLEFAAPKDLINYKTGEKFFAQKYFEQDIYGDLRPYMDGWPDGPGWTPLNVGKFAKAQWLAGKPDLADAILQDAGFGAFEYLPEPVEPPYNALENLHFARHARSLDLAEGLRRTWPYADSNYHGMLKHVLKTEQYALMMQQMEAEIRPDRDGYSGERGLLYAFLLYKDDYFFFAERQIDRLAEEANPTFTESLPYRLLRGAIKWERRHYKESWAAYVEAGTSLVE